MNLMFADLLQNAEGRYLHPNELKSLHDYVEGIPKRVRIYQVLQSKESELLDRVIEKFQPMLPNLTRRHGVLAWERCRRDLSMVWRYCCMAMLLNDEDYLRDKLLYWLETILKSFKMRDECKPAYKLMLDSLPYVFGSEESEMIRPYLILAKTMLVS
ncbi:phycobilisome protein [Thermostichus vulcanus]|uniref:Phycobilisome protein n=1 Tax=Thermostichus vulcanus str. 'Rupite' TaxID=2813851 RepID=A0ABT0C7P5_THEVL|nr:phycobilisome protein [Thermostichus vulcanus]MCJ2541709.1 phycobilisome protein [Thermostichus vulcanus str. 'Rupite']